MTTKMKSLLEDPSNTGAIQRVWPLLEEILNEQQRIMVQGEPCTPEELKGFVIAYRSLEQFNNKHKDKP